MLPDIPGQVRLKKLGVSTDVIGEALGHSDYRITEIYLQEFDRDVIDKANELVAS